MATTTTKLYTEISGVNLTNRIFSTEYTIAGKYERTFNDLINTDGAQSIPITKYGTLKEIMINSTNAILTLTLSDASTIILPIAGLFQWTISSTFAALISTITISTESLIAVDVDVVLFGI